MPPSSFGAGARASLPIALGYFPIGISFGVAASRMGFSAAEAGFLSATIYAGASQFLALALLAGGTPVLVAVASIVAVNLRHVLYGPAILEKAGPDAPRRLAWAWTAGLSDGAFTSAYVALSKGMARFSERFMFGIAVGPYLSWVCGTLLGALIGGNALAGWPALDAALGFLMPALFLAMLLPMLTRTHIPVIAVAAGVALVLCILVSNTVGILAGMVAGSTVAIFRKDTEEDRDHAA